MHPRGGRVQDAAGRSTRSLIAAALAAAVAASAVPLGKASGTAAGLSPCVTPDNGVPVVRDVTLSTAAVDVTDAARRVNVTMRVADTSGPGPATGVRHVSVALAPPRGVPELPLELERRDDGTWATEVTVPRGAPEGDYAFRNLRVLDHAGNEPAEEHRDLALARAPFAGTVLHVTSRSPDTEPPTVRAVTVGPHRVDTRRRARPVRVVAQVRDDVSGTASVVAGLRGHDRQLSVRLHERDGEWVGTATIPRRLGAEPDRWRIRSLSVVDRVGNRSFHDRDELAALGRTSFRVTSGPRDRAEPRISSARFGPHDVDVRVERARVRFVVRAGDRGSGIASVRAGVPGHWVTLRRTAGTARSGTWRGSIVLRPCSRHLSSSQVRVVALDQDWNEVDQGIGRLRMKANDTEPPRARLPETVWPSTGPVRLAFDEPVHGITAESVTVRKYDYPFLGAPLDGSWTCAAGDGRPGDCVSGAVRTASWTPAGPLPAGSEFLVELNPSGILDVTDLAGNPFRRTILYGRT
jgi:hypothetical protein